LPAPGGPVTTINSDIGITFSDLAPIHCEHASTS
jgi:hypothetical protein